MSLVLSFITGQCWEIERVEVMKGQVQELHYYCCCCIWKQFGDSLAWYRWAVIGVMVWLLSQSPAFILQAVAYTWNGEDLRLRLSRAYPCHPPHLFSLGKSHPVKTQEFLLTLHSKVLMNLIISVFFFLSGNLNMWNPLNLKMFKVGHMPGVHLCTGHYCTGHWSHSFLEQTVATARDDRSARWTWRQVTGDSGSHLFPLSRHPWACWLPQRWKLLCGCCFKAIKGSAFLEASFLVLPWALHIMPQYIPLYWDELAFLRNLLYAKN
jgi:hypothetical protein